MNKLKKVNPVLVVATIVVIGIFSLLLITFINKNTDGTDTVSNTTNETSSVFDPKSTGIFVDVFLQGEEDQQADVDYSSLSKSSRYGFRDTRKTQILILHLKNRYK